MRLPRFTTLQLLLVATLAALITGLFTSAWWAAGIPERFEYRFSQDGNYLHMQHAKGPEQLWQIDSQPPQLISAVFAGRKLNRVDIAAIQHIDEGQIRFLLKVSDIHGGAGSVTYTFYGVGHNERLAQMAVLVVGFALWSVIWGRIRKRFSDTPSPCPAVMASTAPLAMRLCWGLMVAGGLVAVAIPIVTMFLIGPWIFPTIYFSLLVGIAAIARGAAGDTHWLRRTAAMQVANIVALDPVNVVFAAMEYALLRSAAVQEYLRQDHLTTAQGE